MRTASPTSGGRSKQSTGKNAGKKIQPAKQAISFREFAEFAVGAKPEHALSKVAGKHVRTAERWLAGSTRRVPSRVVTFLFSEICRRLT